MASSSTLALLLFLDLGCCWEDMLALTTFTQASCSLRRREEARNDPLASSPLHSWSRSVDCGSSTRHLSSGDFVYCSMSSQQQPRSRNNKRARVDEEAIKEEDQDVRLCAVLRACLEGAST